MSDEMETIGCDCSGGDPCPQGHIGSSSRCWILKRRAPQPPQPAADAGLSAEARRLASLYQGQAERHMLAMADELDRLQRDNGWLRVSLGELQDRDENRCRELAELKAREAEMQRDVAERDAEITRLRREVEDTRATAERLHDSEARLREALEPFVRYWNQQGAEISLDSLPDDFPCWVSSLAFTAGDFRRCQAALTENQAEAPGRLSAIGMPITEQYQGVEPRRLDRQTTANNSGRDVRHESPAPDGWKLVPREPTPEMLVAVDRVGLINHECVSIFWRAMWDAAPQQGAPDKCVNASKM